jgi:hypothetical protein
VAGEAEAVRALTVLVAVCEQAIAALEVLDPPLDRNLIEYTERVRDLSMVEINFGRFGPRE